MSEIKDLYTKRVIDNRNVKMVDAIKELLGKADVHSLDVAVGYFYLSGLLLIKDEFIRFMTEQQGHFSILMGNETNQATQQLLAAKDANENYFEQLPEIISQDTMTVSDTDFLRQVGQWINQRRIEVKVYTGEANYFHAKSYLFCHSAEGLDGYALVGSSNFSRNGLEGNTELNVMSRDTFPVLKEWFDTIWQSNEVEPYDEKLIAAIEQKVPSLANEKLYQTVSETYHDYATLFGVPYADLDAYLPWVKMLYPHQRSGVVEISDKLNTFGTAVLADGVGLGKTRTTAGIIRQGLDQGTIHQVLLIADSKLATQWVEEMATVGVHQNCFQQMTRQHFTLLKKPKLDLLAKQYDMIVIDEAHLGFKSRKTKAYAHLQYVFETSGEKIKGLLLTATPWNNSREDVLNLGSLFLSVDRIPSDRKYRDIFQFGNTGKAIRELANDNESFNQFWDDLFLQRTRKTYGGKSVEYAEREFPAIEIPYEPRKNQLFGENFERIAGLNFAYMDPIRYVGDSRNQVGVDRLKMILLKRADSSWRAYHDSLISIVNKLEKLSSQLGDIQHSTKQAPDLRFFLAKAYKLDDYNEQKLGGLREAFYGQDPDYGLDDTESNDLLPSEERSNQQKRRYFNKISAQVQSVNERTAKRAIAKMAQDTVQDLTILKPLLQDLETAYANRDEKLEGVKQNLIEELSQGRKVIIISSFKTTAEYYFAQLKQMPEFNENKIGLVTGGDAANFIGGQEVSRKEILDRFSPRSKNRVDLIDSPEEINLLIGTDTISTGQNLQDAQVIMNLDLPYNPMILEQRIGRIDRPRDVSKTKSIYVYTFPVYQTIDAELKMSERLGKKMEGVMEDTQFDNAVLPNAEYMNFLKQAKATKGNAVQKMLDDTVQKTVVKAGLSSEKHSEQYQAANRRMYDAKIEPIIRTKDPVISKVSFASGTMHGVAVLRLTFNDVNQASLARKNIVVDLTNVDNDSVTNGEQQLHDALNTCIDGTSQLNESTAKLSVSKLDVAFRQVLEREVAKYNQAMRQSEDAIDTLKDRVAEQTAKAIEESVRNAANHTMIMNKIQEAGLTPKIVGKLTQNIRTIDQDSPLYEDVVEISHDVNLFWLNFGYYADQFDLENIELTGKRQLSRMDVRLADGDQSKYELLLANVII